MGIHGSEFARDSSDTVILDENFRSVVHLFRGGPLWASLLTDTLGAIALATKQPTDKLMLKSRMASAEPLIRNTIWRNLIVQVSCQIAVILILQFKGEEMFRIIKKVRNTSIFNTLSFAMFSTY